MSPSVSAPASTPWAQRGGDPADHAAGLGEPRLVRVDQHAQRRRGLGQADELDDVGAPCLRTARPVALALLEDPQAGDVEQRAEAGVAASLVGQAHMR